jgi:bifunctional non-homologous end joining protein LigD
MGKLKFVLHGEKLRGRWMLVRTGGGHTDGDKRGWLLFKERDEEAKPKSDVLDDLPLSVSTRRSLEEIASASDSVWNGKPKANGQSTRGKKGNDKRPPLKSRTRRPRSKRSGARSRRIKDGLSKLEGTKAGTLPTRVDVQLATLAKEAPGGDEWLHEMKLDGYRMICRIDNGRVDFVTRNHKNWTERLGSLAEAAGRLPASQAILDGEVVAMRPDGTTNFQDLQNAFRDNRANHLRYYAFDLLHLDGVDLTRAPLEERKRVLAGLLSGSRLPANIRLSEHIEGKVMAASPSDVTLTVIRSCALGRRFSPGGNGVPNRGDAAATIPGRVPRPSLRR